MNWDESNDYTHPLDHYNFVYDKVYTGVYIVRYTCKQFNLITHELIAVFTLEIFEIPLYDR